MVNIWNPGPEWSGCVEHFAPVTLLDMDEYDKVLDILGVSATRGASVDRGELAIHLGSCPRH
jgi:hypothetical protein